MEELLRRVLPERSTSDRVVAGLCEPIARRLGWRTSSVRILFVAGTFFTGFGLPLYLGLWLVSPTEGGDSLWEWTWPLRLGAITAAFAFVLGTRWSTAGVIEDRDGLPVAGADVLLVQDDRIVATSRTDGEGHFRFRRGHGAVRELVVCAPRMVPQRSFVPSSWSRSFVRMHPEGDGMDWPLDARSLSLAGLPESCQRSAGPETAPRPPLPLAPPQPPAPPAPPVPF
jgi:phage shock protein PspC (stress-responsive transcriptional regulator)